MKMSCCALFVSCLRMRWLCKRLHVAHDLTKRGKEVISMIEQKLTQHMRRSFGSLV